MTTSAEAQEFARHWISAWNSHDLEAILQHYSPDAVLTSPVAARLLNDASGEVRGSENLRNYFRRGLEAFPDLSFELLEVLCGLSSVVLYYKNQKGTRTAEFMEFAPDGKVVRVVANYSI